MPLTATSNVGSEIYVEEQNGDILNDAVFKRNSMVEEKLNVEITKVEATTPKTELTNAVMAPIRKPDSGPKATAESMMIA